jgi:hypothetical protein
VTVTPEAHLRARLLASPVFAALTQSIEPSSSSEKTGLPRVVYTRISRDGQHHMQAASGLVYLRIQFDIFAKHESEASAIADAMRNRLDGYRGTITTLGEDRRFDVVQIENERGESVPPTDGSDKITFRRMVDVFVGCAESIPNLTD